MQTLRYKKWKTSLGNVTGVVKQKIEGHRIGEVDCKDQESFLKTHELPQESECIKCVDWSCGRRAQPVQKASG